MKTKYARGSLSGVLLLVVIGWSRPLLAQGVISGKVVKSPTQEPLANVNVRILGTMLGAASGKNGYFIIQKVPAGVYNLQVSHMGYRTRRIADVRVVTGDTARVFIQLRQAIIEFDPVIVTASKQSQKLMETPNSVSVLSEEDLVARGIQRVDRALEAVPGVHFMQNQINVRGSSGFSWGAGSRVMFLVDGIPMLTSDTGEINWDLLPILDVDHIEVVKGAGSALYGSSALGGVVNIITKEPTARGKLSLRSSIGAYDRPYYKEWRWTDRLLNFNRVDVSYSRRFGPLGMRLTAGRHESTGYQENADFERLNATGKFDYRFADGSKLTVYVAWMRDHSGIFFQWLDQNHALTQDPESLTNRLKINGLNLYSMYTRAFSSKLAMKWRLSYGRTLMGNQYQREGEFFPGIGLGAEIQTDWLPHPAHNLTFGLEFKRDSGNTKWFGAHQGYTLAPYLQEQWRPLNTLRVTLGVRFDRYKLLDGPEDRRLSPKFGINYTPFAGTTLRASAGSGFRAPTIGERFSSFDVGPFHVLANENLKPERSWCFDVGIRQQLTLEWYFDLAVFQNEFYDLIEPTIDYYSFNVQFLNITRARIRGLEFATEGRWWKDRLGFRGNLTWMSPRDLKLDQYLAYRPRLLMFLIPSLRWWGLELQAEYRYASRLEDVKVFRSMRLHPRVPQKVWNFRLIYRLSSFSLIAAVNNAFNYNYTQIEHTLGEIRNAVITMTAKF